VSGIATPEYDVGVASTKKKRAAIMSELDRYILSMGSSAESLIQGSERLV
jgi:hypothetical protein